MADEWPNLPSTDLRGLERAIAKEPPYRSKSTKYGLLVFGPEAKTRVWLVLDGDRLYVDRNGNGDLTEDGKCIAKKPTLYDDHLPVDFAIGDIVGADHKTVYSGIAVQEIEEGGAPMVFIFAHPSGRRAYTGRDASGRLRFGDSPLTAPVIHIDGPLSMGLATRERSAPVQFVRAREVELCASVGTPGLGIGTFMALRHAEVPPGKHPTAMIEFPSRGSGEPPILVHLVLSERC
jgi:hypothetical protein